MMQHFKIRYIPGGMGLNHSGWWLCETVFCQGMYVNLQHRYLKRSDYI